ncbi:hypothetical protein BurMR1_1893 [Burkholderia sp. MR1]|nr:hypothetical protein BurMR1_1893 [Burkholderia sp. MR1]
MASKQEVSATRWRRLWIVLAAICAADAVGMFALAPVWNNGTTVGEIHGLAVFVASAAVTFLSRAYRTGRLAVDSCKPLSVRHCHRAGF